MPPKKGEAGKGKGKKGGKRMKKGKKAKKSEINDEEQLEIQKKEEVSVFLCSYLYWLGKH